MSRWLRAVRMAAICATAMAQAPEEVRVGSRPYVPVQLRTESTVVQVGVVVRDGKGRAVAGLQKDDFRLTDQGKERGITSFAVDVRDVPAGIGMVAAKGHESSVVGTNAAGPAPPTLHPPRFIAMFFDDIVTASGNLARMKRDAARFVEDGMSPGDRIAIVASSAGRMTGFLTDKKQIEDAIGKVQAHPRFPPGGTSSCPRITPYDAYVIANYLSEEAMQVKIIELAACAGTQAQLGGGLNGKTLPQKGRPTDTDAGSQLRNLIQQLADEFWNQVMIASQANMDAVAAALGDLSQQKGMRMLLLVSSGFLTGTLETVEDSLADKALAAGVVINAMDAKGLYVESPVRPFGEPAPMENTPALVTAYETMTANAAAETPTAVLADLAEATGGLFFHHNNDFTFGFRELGSIPEVTYVLAFHPDDAALDGKLHKLKVRLRSSNSYIIEARPGYFASPHAASEDKSRAELDRQVMGIETIQQFPASVEMQYRAKTATGATPIEVRMHIDVKALEFGEANGRHLQKLTFVFALLNQNGAIVSAREGVMDLALTDAKFESIRQTGVNAALTLEAPAGQYRLRAVALEGRGQMAARAYTVNVP